MNYYWIIYRSAIFNLKKIFKFFFRIVKINGLKIKLITFNSFSKTMIFKEVINKSSNSEFKF